MKRENVYMGTLVKTWMHDKNIKYVTFSVTDDCNLMCEYCYFTHKTNKNKLSLDVAKKAVDYILSEESFLIHDGVVWDFIGGEPTLEMDLIDEICDYILYKMYTLNHKWLYCYRFMIGTNGLLYGSEKFQKFLLKHQGNLHVNITVDGSKEKHDLSRIKKDGSGSYDDIVKILPLWFQQTANYSTKSTFSHADLPFLKDSIVNLWNLGFKNVMANVVFENAWHENDEEIYESQLLALADYIIDNKLWNTVSVRFFSPTIGYPVSEQELKVNYCGSGNMLAVCHTGKFYPCIRFMDSALNNHEARTIGDIYNGIDTEKIRAFNALSTETQSSDKCLSCDVAKGCSWCTGLNYDESENGTIFSRATYHCQLHKANVRANNYFWRRYEEVTGNVSPLRYNKYTNISKNNKYLYILHDNVFSYCNVNACYESKVTIDDEKYLAAIEFCEKNNYIPVHVGFETEREFGYYIGSVNAVYERNEMTVDVVEHADIANLPEVISTLIIYRTNFDSLEHVVSDLSILFKYNVSKITLTIVDYHKWSTKQVFQYKKILADLTELVFSEWSCGHYIQIDVITDNLLSDKKSFCLAGERNLTFAPDGNIYPCQAFYFNDSYCLGEVSSLKDLSKSNIFLTMCNKCEANNCKKCLFLNNKTTSEKDVPFELHCIKTNLELLASCSLLHKIRDASLVLNFDINDRIRASKDLDPLISLRGNSFINKGYNDIFTLGED